MDHLVAVIVGDVEPLDHEPGITRMALAAVDREQHVAADHELSQILLVSAELDEVLELSDRVGVMYRGELVAVVDARTADREDVGLLMATGGKAPTEVTKDMAADLEEVS